MELRHLESFIAVAEELHFGRAAARLHIAQPPLSQRIARLETELGVALFHRDRRSVSLTAAGALLLPQARRVLAAAGGLVDTAAGVRTGYLGTVRIAAVGSAFYESLPRLLAGVRERLPGLIVTVVELESAQQIEHLLTGQIDVGFLRPPVPRPLACRTVVREALVVALPAGHPLATHDVVDIGRLADEPFVLFRREGGPGYYDLVDRACRAAGFVPRVAITGEHVHAMVGLVAAGYGVTLVPASTSRLQPPDLVFRPLAREVLLPLAVAWDPGLMTPASRRFCDAL